jgi:hypothetical protein
MVGGAASVGQQAERGDHDFFSAVIGFMSTV